MNFLKRKAVQVTDGGGMKIFPGGAHRFVKRRFIRIVHQIKPHADVEKRKAVGRRELNFFIFIPIQTFKTGFGEGNVRRLFRSRLSAGFLRGGFGFFSRLRRAAVSGDPGRFFLRRKFFRLTAVAQRIRLQNQKKNGIFQIFVRNRKRQEKR